jgi:Icc-related predicted phosphoesterase
VIRIAAVGDIHFGADSAGMLRAQFEDLSEHADALLLAGDLTKCGGPDEGLVASRELAGLPVPVVAVLGNHDYHSDEQATVRAQLEDAGVTVLEGETITINVGGARLGIAGTKGFGGGFAGASGTDFGEPEMKAFVRHTMGLAENLEDQLRSLERCDARIALLHYSPVRDTLAGERSEIFPFLGSYLLAEAIDRAGADLALHGHAHAGTEKGVTPGGVLVRNVAQAVIKHAFNVYTFEPSHPRAEVMS